jgi:DNA-binding MarR family transcriptional regulator
MATGPGINKQVGLSRAEQRKLGQALRVAADYRAVFGRRQAADAGTARDQEVLLALARMAPATASEIARLLGRDRPTTTRALERLRGRRLIRIDVAQGRARPHQLTAAGWRVVHAALAEL